MLSTLSTLLYGFPLIELELEFPSFAGRPCLPCWLWMEPGLHTGIARFLSFLDLNHFPDPIEGSDSFVLPTLSDGAYPFGRALVDLPAYLHNITSTTSPVFSLRSFVSILFLHNSFQNHLPTTVVTSHTILHAKQLLKKLQSSSFRYCR